MGMKSRKKEQTGHYPDSIPSCYIEDGKLVVPPEWEDYYVRTWKWKQVRGFIVDAIKLRYLKDFEDKNGKITEWRDPYGNLRAL